MRFLLLPTTPTAEAIVLRGGDFILFGYQKGRPMDKSQFPSMLLPIVQSAHRLYSSCHCPAEYVINKPDVSLFFSARRAAAVDE